VLVEVAAVIQRRRRTAHVHRSRLGVFAATLLQIGEDELRGLSRDLLRLGEATVLYALLVLAVGVLAGVATWVIIKRWRAATAVL
jgi:hypothetical protein